MEIILLLVGDCNVADSCMPKVIDDCIQLVLFGGVKGTFWKATVYAGAFAISVASLASIAALRPAPPLPITSTLEIWVRLLFITLPFQIRVVYEQFFVKSVGN